MTETAKPKFERTGAFAQLKARRRTQPGRRYTEEQVTEIYRLLVDGTPVKQIPRKLPFAISPVMVGQIAAGKIYKDCEPILQRMLDEAPEQNNP